MKKQDKEKVLNLIEEIWAIGGTDVEAILWAQQAYPDLPPSWLQGQYKSCPDLKARREILKSRPKLTARKTVADRIAQGDLDTAKWYLERKAKEEFSTKTNLEASLDANINEAPVEEKEESLRNFLANLTENTNECTK